MKAVFPIEPDSIYCFDRGHNDFTWFRRIQEAGAFFVTRGKCNLDCIVVGQYGGASKGVITDSAIELMGEQSVKVYPWRLRKVEYYYEENDRYFTFLTNNFELSGETIADIYKSRWQIEAFFQVDKAEFEDKEFFRNQQECGDEPGMGGDVL